MTKKLQVMYWIKHAIFKQKVKIVFVCKTYLNNVSIIYKVKKITFYSVVSSVMAWKEKKNLFLFTANHYNIVLHFFKFGWQTATIDTTITSRNHELTSDSIRRIICDFVFSFWPSELTVGQAKLDDIKLF